MKYYLLILALIPLAAVPTLAQETFSFQGKLTMPDGAPVPDATYSVRFQLFNDHSGGSPQWGEAHAVTTESGIFSVTLGTKTTLRLDAFEAMPYLLLIVNNEAMAPRIPLTAVPYAMKSYRLDEAALHAGDNVTIRRRTDGALEIEATGGGGTGGLTSVARDATLVGNGTSSSPLGLANGSVTGVKLANGVLVAGQNVTVTRQTGGAFEVAATSGGGGLTQVARDATLAGDGTAGNPLQVSVPLVLTNPGNGTVLEAHNGTGTLGYLGGSESGASGESSQGHRGLLGGAFSGVFGLHSNGNAGDLGSSNYGAYGFSNTEAGVYGAHNSGSYGLLGSRDQGVYGEHSDGHFGLLGGLNGGAKGESSQGHRGTLGGPNSGVQGRHSGGNIGSLGSLYAGVSGSSLYDFAGSFFGHVQVVGNLSKSSGSFKIDHPLDPANKYLSHSFVESPDMMNVYNGNVTTDDNGEAIVTLPDYFEALNRDFRYQLTPIGTPGPNLYIAEKIDGNTFKIAGGAPGMEVSWQVTGIRQDAWAEHNRIVVEEDKPAKEQGFYLHPKLFGQPQERSVDWARDPEGMREMQEPVIRSDAEKASTPRDNQP